MKIQAERIPFGDTDRTVARGDHSHPGLGTGIVKSGNESKNSTTVLSPDSELTIELEAGKRYLVRGVVFTNSPNSAMGVKYGLAYSGLATREYSVRRHIAPGATTETIVTS